MLHAIREKMAERAIRRAAQAEYMADVEYLATLIQNAQRPGRRHAVGAWLHVDRVAGRLSDKWAMPAAAIIAHAKNI